MAYSEGLEFVSNGDGTCYVSGIGTCTDLDISIPPVSPDGDEVTGIGSNAFGHEDQITRVQIPGTVRSIGVAAFNLCSGLSEIVLPESVTSIGRQAFGYCSALTAIELPDGLTDIGNSAFTYCIALSSIDIPDNVSEIAETVFMGCASLTHVGLSDGLSKIGAMAFYNCTALEEIVLPQTLGFIDDLAFSYCTALEEITIPAATSRIDGMAFDHCSALLKAKFVGHPPETFGSDVFRSVASGFTILAPENDLTWQGSAYDPQTGKWNGYLIDWYTTDYIISDGVLRDIGNAIRAKRESTAEINPLDMADEIRAISTGIEPSGNVELTQKAGTDVTNYATASVRAGSVSASASKGAVSNHSVAVTPSAAVGTPGWVDTGATGTPVTVTAAELVSGNIELTEQADNDVTEYATASVRGASVSLSASKGTASNASVVVTASATVGESGWIDTAPTSATTTVGVADLGITTRSDSGNVTLDAGTASKSYAAGYYPSAHGAQIVTETKTATANGTVTPDTGKVLSSVTVAIPEKDSTDLTASGKTVSVPAGYYPNGASKAVANGSVSASASKGAVSNHAVQVTPSASVSPGWVDAGATGTPATVTAAELVSGSETKTANGTFDVTNLAQLVVAIPYYEGW